MTSTELQPASVSASGMTKGYLAALHHDGKKLLLNRDATDCDHYGSWGPSPRHSLWDTFEDQGSAVDLGSWTTRSPPLDAEVTLLINLMQEFGRGHRELSPPDTAEGVIWPAPPPAPEALQDHRRAYQTFLAGHELTLAERHALLEAYDGYLLAKCLFSAPSKP